MPIAVDDARVRSMCLGALDFQSNLQQLSSDFRITPRNVAAGDVGRAGFFATLAREAVDSGADAVIACLNALDASSFMHALLEGGPLWRWEAVFLSDGPAQPAFVSTFKGSAEYVMTAIPWSPQMQYADSFFGSAATYAQKFQAAMGTPATPAAAGVSAAAYTLALAISKAFAGCTLSANATDADALLFGSSALDCPTFGAAHRVTGINIPGLGYELVREALVDMRAETMYGPVEFSADQQNLAKASSTAQVQGGALQVVLPLTAANRLPVVPIPQPPVSSKRLSGGAVAAIVACSVVGASALLLAWLYRRQRKRNRTLFGQVRAPGVSPSTTLLVTDIQSSTTLWESLPAEVRSRPTGQQPPGLRRGASCMPGPGACLACICDPAPGCADSQDHMPSRARGRPFRAACAHTCAPAPALGPSASAMAALQHRHTLCPCSEGGWSLMHAASSILPRCACDVLAL